MLGQVIRDDLPWQHLLSYVEAILRVYNRYGRRDNKYKARIKILVKALGIEAFSREVEEEWQHLRDGPAQLTAEEYQRVAERHSIRRSTRLPTSLLTALRWLPTRPSPAGSRATSRRTGWRATPAWCCRPSRAPARRRATPPRSRWSGSPTGPSATASARSVSPTNRTWCSPDVRKARPPRPVAGGLCRRPGHAEPGPADRHHRLPRRRFLRAGQRQVDPHRPGHPAALRGPGLPARPRRPQPEHLRLHERLRPPPHRQHRHPRRRQERQRVVPDHPRRRAGQGERAGQGDRPIVRSPPRCRR